MKLVVGPTFTEALPEHWMETTALQNALTFTYGRKNEEEEYCLIDNEGRFPSGLLKFVLQKLAAQYITVEVDNPFPPDKEDYEINENYLDGITLRDYQIDAIEKALARRRGIIKVATGGGKTEIQAGVIQAIGRSTGGNTLTVVTGLKGCNQTYKRFIRRGIENVGRLSGDHWDINAQHLVSTFQTLYSAYKRRDDDLMHLLNTLKVIQFDECHHEGADSWYLPGTRVNTERKISYSATPFHDDIDAGHPYDMRLRGLTGDVLVNVSSKYLRDRGFLVDPDIYSIKITTPNMWKRAGGKWAEMEDMAIVSNDVRNTIASNITINQVGRHRVAILVRRIKHGQDILLRLHAAGISAKFCSGGAKVHIVRDGEVEHYKDPDDEALEEYSRGEYQVLIGSGIFDEVVDLPVISCLIILSGGKKAIRSLQRVGRALRPNSPDPFNEECLIFDFFDDVHPWFRNHSKARIRDYEDEDYRVHEQVPIDFLAVTP